jgi:LysM repeat protein
VNVNFPGADEFNRADYRAAAGKLTEYVKTDRKNPSAFYMLGRSLLEMGQAAEAEPALEQAAQLDPGGPTGTAAALSLADALYARCYARAEEQDRAKWETIRALYSAALRNMTFGPARDRVVERLNTLNAHLLWGKMPTADSVQYKVMPGDNVEKIALQHGLPRDCALSISRINRLKDSNITVGQTLKVIRPLKMEMVVNKTALKLTAYLNGYFFGEFPVGIGKAGATPPGEFVLAPDGKDREPNWTQTLDDGSKKMHAYGSKENILGTRWMGMVDRAEVGATGLGIHGTTQPETVPGRESAGCVRMLNNDVELLYDFTPGGSKIVIVN